jgi:hypothetical protein
MDDIRTSTEQVLSSLKKYAQHEGIDIMVDHK